MKIQDEIIKFYFIFSATFPFSYRLLCLGILLRCKWPCFDVQDCENWINVLCFIIETGRNTKKALKVVVPISDSICLGIPL